MANVRLIQLAFDVINKALVAYQVPGTNTTTPSQFPWMYYLDNPTIQIFPVQPSSPSTAGQNSGPLSGGQYQPFTLAGYTANITLGPAPNAASPQASYASLDTIPWDATSNSFFGAIGMSSAALLAALGSASSISAYFNFDVFDASLDRSTLYQSKQPEVTIAPSIDTPAAGPAGPATIYPTLQQLLGIFLQIGGFPGKFCVWESPDSTKEVTQQLGNDGNMDGI